MGVYIGKPVVISDMQGPAPDGFHVPLITEWQAIFNTGASLGAWSGSNGTNLSTYLKLPMAGTRNYDTTTLNSVGARGFYWSSSPSSSSTGTALYLDLRPSYIGRNGGMNRSNGSSVRCIKNSPAIPTSSWTKLYGTSIESGGIFHNPTDGLISLSSDGITWYTLMDKNLGATTVYNYGDTITEANGGKFYQWGNNYGFAHSGTLTTSSTQVDVTGYGPGNYYNSSTWITTSPRQSSASDGKNLWGGVSQGSTIKGVELKNAYIGEYHEQIIFTIPSTQQTSRTSSNLYKSGKTIVEIVIEADLIAGAYTYPMCSVGCIRNATSGDTKALNINFPQGSGNMQTGYGTYSSYNQGTTTVIRDLMQTFGGTVHFKYTVSKNGWEITYGANSYSGTFSSDQLSVVTSLFEGNAYVYNQTPNMTIGETTITVTYS